MALKSEHFITPIKLVLPGIIVSLVGASSAFFYLIILKKTKPGKLMHHGMS